MRSRRRFTDFVDHKLSYCKNSSAKMSQNEPAEPRWIRRQGAYASRSKVWQHFCVRSDDVSKTKCDYCPKILIYSGSTTNQWEHLKKFHPSKIEVNLDEPQPKASVPRAMIVPKNQPLLPGMLYGKDPRAKVC